MEHTAHTLAARIAADDLQGAASQGVQRALAARKAMTELSAEQTHQVSGAAFAGTVVPGWWIYGQPAFWAGNFTQPAVNPAELGGLATRGF